MRKYQPSVQAGDFEFIRHDINTPFDPESYPELARFKIKFQGIQEIYHLACPTGQKIRSIPHADLICEFDRHEKRA